MKTLSARKSWNRFSLALTAVTALSFATSSQPAAAAMFTVGGFSWDDANSVSTVKVVEGKVDGCYSIDSQVPADFNPGKTLGKILAGGCPEPVDGYSAISLPEGSAAQSPKPNVDRTSVELTWGDRVLPNLSGNDFVIYEAGNIDGPEGYSVSVRKVGESTFRPARYKFYDNFEALATNIGVFATAFNLDDFGLADGDAIDAIALRNLFNSDANSGADKVDNSIGFGKLLYPGDPDYSNGYSILTSAAGSEYTIDKLDADLAYVIGLHNVLAPPSQQKVPEPTSVLGLLALGAVGLTSRLVRK